MARAVQLWIGKTDDSRPPPRVLLRIFTRENGVCHISGRKIAPGEKWQADHKIAIINGGRNSEDNLFPALVDKHAEKTKADVAEKSHVAVLAKSNIGASAPSRHPMNSPQKPKRESRPVANGMTNLARRFRSAT